MVNKTNDRFFFWNKWTVIFSVCIFVFSLLTSKLQSAYNTIGIQSSQIVKKAAKNIANIQNNKYTSNYTNSSLIPKMDLSVNSVNWQISTGVFSEFVENRQFKFWVQYAWNDKYLFVSANCRDADGWVNPSSLAGIESQNDCIQIAVKTDKTTVISLWLQNKIINSKIYSYAKKGPVYIDGMNNGLKLNKTTHS
ncbi:MAG: hypothetical protein HRT89_16010, partial [Lentisphaeria bacterium]|nr:hypothetical protein [Lentisphaeria bacterium]NQZ69563.1 hypothetical protein [Lentisphaeria bacterium]